MHKNINDATTFGVIIVVTLARKGMKI